MNQLVIVDLNFLENELPSDRQVKGGGGVTVNSPTGSWSSSYNYDKNWGYYASPSSGVGGYVQGATAGAVAGAVSDGYTYASTSTSAGT